jgi:hypothetical protein
MFVGVEFLTAVIMKSGAFLDIRLSSQMKMNQISEKYVASIVRFEE